MARNVLTLTIASILTASALSACIPIKLQAPDEPIRIDLNVRIDQEVRVRLEDDVNDLITSNPDLF